MVVILVQCLSSEFSYNTGLPSPWFIDTMSGGVNGFKAVWGENSVLHYRWVIGSVVGHLLCSKDSHSSLTSMELKSSCLQHERRITMAWMTENLHQHDNVLMLYIAQDLSLTGVFTGIVQSVDPRDTLSLLHSTEDQDCLLGPHQHSPVLFGVDSVSGCTLRQDINHT